MNRIIRDAITGRIVGEVGFSRGNMAYWAEWRNQAECRRELVAVGGDSYPCARYHLYTREASDAITRLMAFDLERHVSTAPGGTHE